jgi:transcriptional regulator with XRE-family HTH domain
MASYVPTIRRRRLGSALRRVREEAGLSTTEVAERLGWSHSKISRIETAKTPVTSGDVRDLLAHYEIASAEAEALVTLAREAKQRGWWHSYSEVLPEWFESYLGLEAEAQQISTYEPQVIPGLLQTEAYAATVLGAHPLRTTPDEMERSVELRRARQARLTGDGEPIQLDAVIGEGALRQQIGGHDVMRDQLQRLLTVGEFPGVTVRMLPFDAGAHPALNGAFTVLEFPDPDDPRIVYIDNLTSSLYLETMREVGLYRLAYQQLQASALQPDETATFIARLTEEMTAP